MTIRFETDFLGAVSVPSEAYYGGQTQRAIENFPLSGVPISRYRELISALALVKKAAAYANCEVGQLSEHKAQAIDRACDDIIAGQYHDQFCIDAIQGGAGTSTNMNANEVITNLALQYLGKGKGEYHHLHPNNDVNMAQSTNDAYPTSLRLGIMFANQSLETSITHLVAALRQKAQAFEGIVKMGRTQLQDAVPMTLGQEFAAFSDTLNEDIQLLHSCTLRLGEVNLGGTAIGTGLNTHPDYAALAVAALARFSGQPISAAPNLVEATSDMGAFVLYSSALKRCAIKLSKIANDLRLLTSGPRAGLCEIELPAVQPGSSIMPGKVNPVIPEAINQSAFVIIGNDVTVSMASEAGQLQLNAMEPVIGSTIFNSINLLRNACDTFSQRCIQGIKANIDTCAAQVENSIGVVTALVPNLGYETASRIARLALEQRCSIAQIVVGENLMSASDLKRLLHTSF